MPGLKISTEDGVKESDNIELIREFVKGVSDISKIDPCVRYV